MNKKILQYLEKLLNSSSPSGYEDKAREIWRAEMAAYADTVYGDTHGNSIAVLNKKGSPCVMLAGHIDEIGFQVQYISPEGYIYFKPIGGGFDTRNIPARRVVIHTASGPVPGVTGKPAGYYMSPENRDKTPEFSDLWIDIGIADGKQVKKMVKIGDPVTYSDGFAQLGPTTFISRGVDDRIGAFVVGEVLKYLQGKKFTPAVYSVATVQEEIGLRGAITSAYGINPDISFVVDVMFGDAPDSDKKKSGEIVLGKGPVVARGANINPKLFALIKKVAKTRKIAMQIEAVPGGTFTDANAIQLSRSGVTTALVSIPTRYLHSPVELFDIRDVEGAVKLIAETIIALDATNDFTL
jgi:putative aminopeptidase FrvX